MDTARLGEGGRPCTAKDITSDKSHKAYWWRSRGVAFDWAAELANNSAADAVLQSWSKAVLADRASDT